MRLLRYVVPFLIEIALVVIYPLCGILGLFFRLNTTIKTTKTPPIIFVNPWISHNIIYYFLKRYLEKNGFIVYIVDYGFRINDFEEAGKMLATFINKNNIKDIILIGSSNSVLTCLTYLQFYNGWHKTRKFISLGGSVYGTSLAYPLAFLKAGKQLLPNSTLLTALHKKKIIAGKTVCFSAKYDELVPISSSTIRGAKHIIIDTCGHNYFHALSFSTFRTVLGLLKQQTIQEERSQK